MRNEIHIDRAALFKMTHEGVRFVGRFPARPLQVHSGIVLVIPNIGNEGNTGYGVGKIIEHAGRNWEHLSKGRVGREDLCASRTAAGTELGIVIW